MAKQKSTTPVAPDTTTKRRSSFSTPKKRKSANSGKIVKTTKTGM